MLAAVKLNINWPIHIFTLHTANGFLLRYVTKNK